jgi:hypothetical protein
MEIVRSFDELKKGDKVVVIEGDKVNIMEFVCLHPKDCYYALFLDDMVTDGAKSVSKTNFASSNAYRFHGTNEEWIEIYQTIIDNLNAQHHKDILWYEDRIKCLAR